MPILKTDPVKAKKLISKFDWSCVDAMTDEDIALQIATGKDVAPDMSAALKKGRLIQRSAVTV